MVGPKSLAGHLLVAMPQMLDPRFARSVIYLCAHSYDAGALGLIINKRLGSLTMGELFTQLDIPVQQAVVTTSTEPRTQAYCDIKPPFQPQLKLLGSYRLPWGLQASAAFQSVPGPLVLGADAIPAAVRICCNSPVPTTASTSGMFFWISLR